MSFPDTCLESFKCARREGVARILHLHALDLMAKHEICKQEFRQWFGRQNFNPSAEQILARRYERRQREIAAADLLITNSALTARSHICAGADRTKVLCVPLAAPKVIEEIHPRPKDGPLNVMWAGNFTIAKGAHHLATAWRSLNAKRGARLDIYGQVGMRGLASKLACDEIVFHGSVPQGILFAAYRSADVLVLPTLSDGFGAVVLEAMAHGVPVITTDQAGAAEFVTSANGIVVPASDPGALTDALRWCLEERDRLAEMRIGAVETARHRQWSDYRRDLIVACSDGLARAGYRPTFVPFD